MILSKHKRKPVTRTFKRKGKPVKWKRPKATTVAKKKAFAKGTWVRSLKTARAKADHGFKRYKGLTFTDPFRITAIKYYGPYPKYKVDGKFYFHDQVIKVAEAYEHRPEDLTSKQLVRMRVMTRSK